MSLTSRKVSNSTQSTSTSRLSLSLPSTLRSRIPETWSRSRTNAKRRRATKAALALRELILDPTTPATPSTEPHALSLAFVPPTKAEHNKTQDKPTSAPDYFRTWAPKRTSERKSTVPRLRPIDVERLRTQLLVPSQASLVIASARTLEPPASSPGGSIGQGAEPMRAVCLDCKEGQAEDMIRTARKAQAVRKGWEERMTKDKYRTIKVAPVVPSRLPVLLSLLGSGGMGGEEVNTEKQASNDEGMQAVTGAPKIERLKDETPPEFQDLSLKDGVDTLPPPHSSHEEHSQGGLLDEVNHGIPSGLIPCQLDVSPPVADLDPYPVAGDAVLPFGLFLPASAMSLHRPLAGALPTPETLRMGFDALINAESKIYLYEGPSHVGIKPPLDRMSIYTCECERESQFLHPSELVNDELTPAWIGGALNLPCLEYLGNCKQMTASLLNLLGVIVYAVPGGTRELAPFVGVLSRFIESEWRTLKSQDRGRGVVCGATWFIPAALVARPWDFDDPLELDSREERARKAANAAMARSPKA